MIYPDRLLLRTHFYIFILVNLFLLQCVMYYFDSGSDYLWFITIVIDVTLLFYYRHSVPVVVILAFFIPYFYIPKFFFVDDLPISFWMGYQTAEGINFISLLNSMFLISFYAGLRDISKIELLNKKIVGVLKDSLFFYVLFFIMLLALHFGLQGQTVFESGGYGTGNVEKSAAYEYFIVFFLTSLLFFNKKSYLQRVLIISIVLVYISKSLVYGGRIEVLQIGLMIMYLMFDFFHGKRIVLLVFSILGFFLMGILSQIRADPALIYSLGDVVIMNNSSLIEKANISSQYGDVYQSSLRIIGLLKDGYINDIDSIYSFVSVLFGAFVPSSLMPAVYNLSSYLQNIEKSGGGGFISAYSYVWLSYLGPVVFGYFIGFVIRYFYLVDKPVINVYGLLVLIMFPRWFAYYPVILFKMCFLGVLIIAFYLVVQKISFYISSDKSKPLIKKVP